MEVEVDLTEAQLDGRAAPYVRPRLPARPGPARADQPSRAVRPTNARRAILMRVLLVPGTGLTAAGF
jgi:hypothetical protein